MENQLYLQRDTTRVTYRSVPDICTSYLSVGELTVQDRFPGFSSSLFQIAIQLRFESVTVESAVKLYSWIFRRASLLPNVQQTLTLVRLSQRHRRVRRWRHWRVRRRSDHIHSSCGCIFLSETATNRFFDFQTGTHSSILYLISFQTHLQTLHPHTAPKNKLETILNIKSGNKYRSLKSL